MTVPPPSRALFWSALATGALIGAATTTWLLRRGPVAAPPPDQPRPAAHAVPPAPAPPGITRRRSVGVSAIVAAVVIAVAAAAGLLAVHRGSGATGADCLTEARTVVRTTTDSSVPTFVPSAPALPALSGTVPTGTAVTLPEAAGAPSDVRAETTVLGVRELDVSALRPAGGNRLVAVRIRIHNVGGIAFVPHTGEHAWVCDTDGNWYHGDADLTRAVRTVPPAALERGWQIEEELVFEVREDARLSRFRFAQRAGDPAQTQDWRLT